MKAIAIKDEKLVWAETPRPQAKDGEVLIKVHAAGVNRADIFQKQGSYKPPLGAPEILGMEVAGEIIEGNEKFAAGEKVCALIPGGGYAEYAAARHVLPIPKGLGFIEAAAIPEAFFTAWYALFHKGGLAKGENLLVHGGASGVGIAAIQLAVNYGAKVFATAGTAEKCTFLSSLGTEKSINYREEDFSKIIKADVILDMVGGEYFQKNLSVLETGGRLVQIAFLAGAKAEVNFAPLLMKDLTITAFRMRNLPDMVKNQIKEELLKNLWPLLESRTIKPVIDSVFGVQQAEQAQQRMEENKNIGKIILSIIPSSE